VVTESGIAGIADMMPSVLCAIGPRLHMASIIGKHIVFTAEPESMNRAEAEVLGAVVGSTVNAETDLLIDGPSDGSSSPRALKYGVEVLNEWQWLTIAGAADAKNAKAPTLKTASIGVRSTSEASQALPISSNPSLTHASGCLQR
jgi:hypothetical protein